MLINSNQTPQVPVFQKEQLLRELDMYQEIAVAKGEHYDRLNRKMDHCQESIETLSDEIQRLQGECSFDLVNRGTSRFIYTPPALKGIASYRYEGVGEKGGDMTLCRRPTVVT